MTYLTALFSFFPWYASTAAVFPLAIAWPVCPYPLLVERATGPFLFDPARGQSGVFLFFVGPTPRNVSGWSPFPGPAVERDLVSVPVSLLFFLRRLYAIRVGEIFFLFPAGWQP